MNRKWIFAVVSVLAVALVMFPLNLLWGRGSRRCMRQ